MDKHHPHVGIFLIFCFIHCSSFTQKLWRAEWIGLPGDPVGNFWTCYIKDIRITSLPARAITKISTDSKYWLYINGRIIVREGQLKRGPNPLNTYYDEINLSPYLKIGNNRISILTWYWGKDGFSHKNSGQPALLFECDDINLISDTSWRLKKQPAFYNPDGIQPNFRLPETNVGFDARKDIDWNQKSISDWPNAISFRRPPVAPWNELIKRPIPFWKDFGLRPYKTVSKTRHDSVITALLPYNAQVAPYFKIRARSGQVIDIRTDHYLTAGKTALASVRTEYITRNGIQEFECPNWMSGQRVFYRIPPGVEILKLKYRETGYDTKFSGQFKCDDEFINSLIKKAQRTLYVNMRDNYFDCPDRERAQWWGDVVIEMGQAFYALDSFANRLSKKAILNLVDWQKSDSVLFSPVPAGNWDKELPVQMLAAIHGIGTYYTYTADSNLIKYVYPSIKKYLSIRQLDSDSLVVHRNGGWSWADWGQDIDVTLNDNGWYCLALQEAIAMAALTGDEVALKTWMKILNMLKINFNRKFWDGKQYRSPGYRGKTDERAHALAVLAGIADSLKYPAILQVFKDEHHASPYMEKYVLEALYIMNEPDLALQRMKFRYSKMLKDPGTTLWELFNQEEESTDDHAWSGGPLTLFYQYVAGIGPGTAGYKNLRIFPRMGHLKTIHCEFQTSFGQEQVDLKHTIRRFEMKTYVLAGTDAVIGIPLRKDRELTKIILNGNLLWRKDGFVKQISGVTKSEVTSSRFFQYTVSRPGKYHFVAEY
jgi:alpha-L-rhamnosidase